jgi:hypothetical protein
MRRIFICCGLSIVLYLLVFAGLVDRPLSLGLLRMEMVQKSSVLASLPSPKIVVLAGSNGPYSHSCAVIGAMLNLPCENAGIAVGIGLDEIFRRDAPLLHAGDIVYMPMELQQYTASRTQYDAGADGNILLRRDRAILEKLPPGRILGAMFCCDLANLLEAFVEMPMMHTNAFQPGEILAAEYNRQGDRIDNNLADASAALLNHPPRPEPTQNEIVDGYGTQIISTFIRQETARNIIVIGGLPTDFSDAALSQRMVSTLASIYIANGGMFAALHNRSLYPAADFFNSEDHLAKPCQFLHSVSIANLLAAKLRLPVQPPSSNVISLAAMCPQPCLPDYPMSAAR